MTVKNLCVLAFFVFSMSCSAFAQQLPITGEYRLISTNNAKICQHVLQVEALENNKGFRFLGIKNFEHRSDWGQWQEGGAKDLVLMLGETKGERQVGEIFQSRTWASDNGFRRKAKFERYWLWPFELKLTMRFTHRLKVWSSYGVTHLKYSARVQQSGTSIIPEYMHCRYERRD